MGEVVQLPVVRADDPRKRRCFNCANGIDTERGTYCEVFSEFLLTELAARDCEVYVEEEK